MDGSITADAMEAKSFPQVAIAAPRWGVPIKRIPLVLLEMSVNSGSACAMIKAWHNVS